MDAHVHGAGKVGRALARGLREAGWKVTLTSHRRNASPRLRAGIVVLAVRDGELLPIASRWASERIVPPGSVVLHVAGARPASELAPLRESCAGVGQMHPLLSFVKPGTRTGWDGATMLVGGDVAAVRAARRIARALGMKPRNLPGLNRGAYHAAAAMLAGGAAALAWASADLLARAGTDRAMAFSMLGPLLRSVADNVGAVGLPLALSGVVRRGDVKALEAHLEALLAYAPHHLDLYRAISLGQVEMARRLGDASERKVAQVEARLARLTVGDGSGQAKRDEKATEGRPARVGKVDRRRSGRYP